MSLSGGHGRIVWRGTPSPGDRRVPVEADALQGDRILVLMGSAGNRALVAEQLSKRFNKISLSGDAASPDARFDVAIVDVAGLTRAYQFLVDAKLREEPSFLPVIVVLPRSALKQRLREYWDVVDEFIVSPVDPEELTERVSMLLHVRHLALTQRSHLAYLVNHDRVTGLANRNLFLERLSAAIRDAAVIDTHVHAVVVRIPMEDALNSLGHHGLDRAAKIWSSRLAGVLPANVELARISTDVWGFVGRVGMPIDALVALCKQVQEVAEQAVEVDGERVRFHLRVGVGTYPQEATTATATLDCATAALSQATREPLAFYSRELQSRAVRFIRTEARLHEGIEDNQLEVWWQPQVRLSDASIIGAEALVRWRLPSGEIVGPGDFLPVAAASGLMSRIDAWMLEHAAESLTTLKGASPHFCKFSVNVSVPHLQQDGFLDLVINVLERYGIPPPQLELELTEDMFLECNDRVLYRLNRLRDYGVEIAVDDFGTGFSSLGYLHTLPITTLKIDRSFIQGVGSNPTSDAITQSIVWLAKNFDLGLVAEGIERPEQLDYLRELGVQRGQGFLFGAPMTTADFRRRLATWKCRG